MFTYILTLSIAYAGPQVYQAIMNSAGTGYPQFGRSGDFGIAEIWLIPKTNKTSEELTKELQDYPFINQVSLVSLSMPITKSERVKVRDLLNNFGWDMALIKNKDLALFLDAKLQGKNN